MNRTAMLCFSLALFTLATSLTAVGQKTTIKGKVFDKVHNQPVKANLTVYLTATRNNTDQKLLSTQSNGQFKAKLASFPDSLKLKAKGYFEKTIALPPNQAQLRGLTIGLTPKSARAFEEVVVTGYDEGSRTRTVPGNIAIVDRQTLQAESDHTIARALDRIPGLHYQQGAYSTGRMTIRGIGSRSPYSTTKIKAYYQEIPLTTGEGITNLMDLAPHTLARAEVIKGPVSSVYGAGLGGAVLLEPKRGIKQGTDLSVGGEAGSHGYWNSQATLTHITKDQQIFTDYTRTHMDGFRGNSRFDRHNATFSGSFFAGGGSTIHVFGSLIHLKSYIPSSLSRETFRNNPQKADKDWKKAKGHEEYDKSILGVSYEAQISPNLESTTALFTNYKNNDEPRPFNILKDQRFSYGARHVTIYSPEILGMQTSWTFGGEFFDEWYQRQTFENLDRQTGAILSNTEQTRQYWNVFTRGKVTITPKLTLSGGINHNRTRYRLNDLLIPDTVRPGSQAYQKADKSGDYQFDPIWSPRVGINYRLRPSHNIYASVSSGFSQPNVQETLDPSGALNPDIKPEKGTSYEIGGKGLISGLGIRYNLSIYHMEVQDKLVARRVGPDRFIGLNAGSTVHNGLEISLEGNYLVKKRLGWLPKLSPFVKYAYQDFRFEKFVEEGRDYSGNELTGTAPHHLTAGLNSTLFSHGNSNRPNTLKVRLTYRYRDRMPVLDDNSIYTKPYSLFGGRLAYKHHFPGITLEAFTAIRNIEDELYAAMIVPNAPGYGGDPRYFYPGEPRTLRFGLQARIRIAK